MVLMTEYSRKLPVTCREGRRVKKCLMEVSDSQWPLGFASHGDSCLFLSHMLLIRDLEL